MADSWHKNTFDSPWREGLPTGPCVATIHTGYHPIGGKFRMYCEDRNNQSHLSGADTLEEAQDLVRSILTSPVRWAGIHAGVRYQGVAATTDEARHWVELAESGTLAGFGYQGEPVGGNSDG